MLKYKKLLVSAFLIFNFIFTNILMASAACCPACQPNCQCPTTCCAPCQQPCMVELPFTIEHLPTYKGSSVNMVKVYSCGAIVQANNVLKVTFSGDFNSKKVCPCDRISFILNEGLKTCEGRCLLPCGTQVIGKIQQIENPKWLNKNAKVYMVFDEMVLPNCRRIPICARVYSKDCVLKASLWRTLGKNFGYTVALFGIGTGIGAAIGTAGKASVGAMTYGMPIGGGVGLLVGLLTPGLHYKAKEGTVIYIQLVQDLCIYCCSQ